MDRAAPRSTFDGDHVWLTFDDGPTINLTLPILNVLAEFRAAATFFVRGEAVQHAPDLLRRVVSRGHTVANHTMTHRDLTTLHVDDVRRELERTNAIIEEVVGIVPKYFRPPFGHFDDRILDVADSLGLETVLWSISAEDWACPGADTIASITIEQARPGAIALFHDGCGHLPHDAPIPTEMCVQLVTALPTILESLQSRQLLARIPCLT